MKVIIITMNPAHRNKKDSYDLAFEHKLKLALKNIDEKSVAGRGRTKSIMFLPVVETNMHLDNKWRTWMDIIERIATVSTVKIGQFSLMSIMQKNMNELVEAVAINTMIIENIILPLPVEVISKFCSVLSSKIGEWKYDPGVLSFEKESKITNGSVIMIDTESVISPTLSFSDPFLDQLEIPDYFFPDGCNSLTEDGKYTMEELRKYFVDYVESLRTVSLQHISGGIKEIERKMRDAFGEKVRALPLHYSDKVA